MCSWQVENIARVLAVCFSAAVPCCRTASSVPFHSNQEVGSQCYPSIVQPTSSHLFSSLLSSESGLPGMDAALARDPQGAERVGFPDPTSRVRLWRPNFDFSHRQHDLPVGSIRGTSPPCSTSPAVSFSSSSSRMSLQCFLCIVFSASQAVRHGAESFNFYFPQDLDPEYLVVWDGYDGLQWR